MDLGPTTFIWPLDAPPEEQHWRVTLRLALVRGRAELVGLEVRGYREEGLDDDLPTLDQDPPVVTAELIRSIPVGRLVDDARAGRSRGLRIDAALEQAAETGMLRRLEPGEPLPEHLQRLAEAYQAGPRRGRPPEYGPEHFAEVARVYAAAWRLGRAPTRAVAERWTVSKATAAKWVARARRLGLLPKTSRGRAAAGRGDTE